MVSAEMCLLVQCKPSHTISSFFSLPSASLQSLTPQSNVTGATHMASKIGAILLYIFDSDNSLDEEN